MTTSKYDWEASIKVRYPTPSTAGIQSFCFSLDGGGRDLVTDAIRDNGIQLMIEIGSFLCGSTLQWMEASDDLTVIGVDPWRADFASFLDRYRDNKVFDSCFSKISDRHEFIESVRNHGPFLSAMANIRKHGDRFFPVRAESPAVLYELAALSVKPEMIYFDSNKLLNDLTIARGLFPRARLCGDDWSWGAGQGYPVQTAVRSFCEEFGLHVRAKRATWIIDD
jgi:hypothetical protein